MPVIRYFGFVGGALLALLFVVSGYFPPTKVDRPEVAIDKTTIRIASRQAGPELVTIDTSQTMMVTAPAAQTREWQPDIGQTVSQREAFAQIDTAPIRTAAVQAAKKPKTRIANPKAAKRFARNHIVQKAAMAQSFAFPNLFD